LSANKVENAKGVETDKGHDHYGDNLTKAGVFMVDFLAVSGDFIYLLNQLAGSAREFIRI